MKKIFLFITLLLFTCLSFAQIQTRNLKTVEAPTENPTNQQRKAVVIGMSNYGGDGMNLPLTINDANDIANVLRQLGFKVTILTDNDLESLETNLKNWYSTIQGNDMAIFYYAGHGVQVRGQNYLLPVDFPHDACEDDVKYKALNANQVVENLDARQVGLKILILDACRTNPLKGNSCGRGIENKGLADMTVPKGTYFIYSTAPGTVAGESKDLQNGIFTYYFKKEILNPGASIDDIVNSTTWDVSNHTGGEQVPYKGGTLAGNYYFIPRSNDRPIPAPAPVTDKYYYYIDQNGNESQNHFVSRENAASEMKRNNLYGKIYSNMGEVFVVDKPAPAPAPPQAEGVVINGVRWATRNVGNTPHTFADSPESYGGYYQWNRGTTTFTVDWNGNNASAWEKASDPCPAGWRVPTVEELKSLDNAGSTWTTKNGVDGRLFGSGYNTLFLPAAPGGKYGSYWSRTAYGTYAKFMFFSSSLMDAPGTAERGCHQNIRCVSE